MLPDPGPLPHPSFSRHRTMPPIDTHKSGTRVMDAAHGIPLRRHLEAHQSIYTRDELV